MYTSCGMKNEIPTAQRGSPTEKSSSSLSPLAPLTGPATEGRAGSDHGRIWDPRAAEAERQQGGWLACHDGWVIAAWTRHSPSLPWEMLLDDDPWGRKAQSPKCCCWFPTEWGRYIPVCVVTNCARLPQRAPSLKGYSYVCVFSAKYILTIKADFSHLFLILWQPCKISSTRKTEPQSQWGDTSRIISRFPTSAFLQGPTSHKCL
jgi:hypothetical protein